MITIRVERSDPGRGYGPVVETYEVPAAEGATVMGALMHVYEAHGVNLAFRCGCRNQDCGLCAVDVNGRPRLACLTPLRDGMLVRPLQRLPVARDLIVDRRWVLELVERFDLFVREGDVDAWPASLAVAAEHARLATCSECLSCLASCPSYEPGRDDLGGPYHFVKLGQLHWDPRDGADRRAQAARLGIARCETCRRCACPLGIPIFRSAVTPLSEGTAT